MDLEEMKMLEKMIDRYTVAGVLLKVAEICYEKEDHIRSHYQDDYTAQVWKNIAAKIDRLAGSVLI